jgi:nucleoside-triphosphatase THEP1
MQKIVLITGAVTSGKTSFLSFLAKLFSPRCQTDGFLAKAPERAHNSGQFASEYLLCRIKKKETHPWATPRKNNRGYFFNPDTQNFLDNTVVDTLLSACPDMLFIDELGKLELSGGGLDKVLRAAISSGIKILVCTVKKKCFDDIVETYGFQNSICIDLDIIDTAQAAEKTTRYIGDSFFSD